MTPKQTEFLLLIAKTGFLTNKHLEQAGLSKINHSNHRTTKDLLLNGFIGRIMVASGFGIGRKVVYFLAKKSPIIQLRAVFTGTKQAKKWRSYALIFPTKKPT
jgi:hypothetical protein